MNLNATLLGQTITFVIFVLFSDLVLEHVFELVHPIYLLFGPALTLMLFLFNNLALYKPDALTAQSVSWRL